MTSIAVTSVAGAPGVTTLVCAMAATSTDDAPLLVVETSSTGGAIAARWRLDVRDSTATAAKLAMDLTPVELWGVAHHPWLGSSRVIPAHPSAAVMRQAQTGRWLAEQVGDVGRPCVIDLGRLDGSGDQLELLAAVDQVWVVIDPVIEHVTAAKAVGPWLDRAGTVEILVRETAGHPARDSARTVGEALGWPVAATVPDDQPSARALCGQAPARRSLVRSPLMRTARSLAGRLMPSGAPA